MESAQHSPTYPWMESTWEANEYTCLLVAGERLLFVGCWGKIVVCWLRGKDCCLLVAGERWLLFVGCGGKIVVCWLLGKDGCLLVTGERWLLLVAGERLLFVGCWGKMVVVCWLLGKDGCLLVTGERWLLLVACFMSQQQTSVSQGRIWSNNSTCGHTETEAAEPTHSLSQSQYTKTGPSDRCTSPTAPGIRPASHWGTKCQHCSDEATSAASPSMFQAAWSASLSVVRFIETPTGKSCFPSVSCILLSLYRNANDEQLFRFSQTYPAFSL